MRKLWRRWVNQILFHPRHQGQVVPDRLADTKEESLRDLLRRDGWPAWRIPAQLRRMMGG